MSKSTDYTSEEWKVVSSAPMMAGLVVSMSDMSGPIGIAKEALAVLDAINDTTTGTSSELIKTVAAEIRAHGGRPDIAQLRTDLSKARATLIERCTQAAALVGKKSPGEAGSYKRWLVSLAQKTAKASKEGTFFGIGGTPVSQAENSAVRDLASALGMSAVEDGSNESGDRGRFIASHSGWQSKKP
jgi:hypothetical protein